MDAEVAIVGAGVVGAATALELARRGAKVIVLEAEAEPGLAASGTNSGVLHTGFDSVPGELETRMILRAAELRDPVLEALEVPVLRCGAELRPRGPEERDGVARLAANATRNGVRVELREDGVLEIPGEAVSDPVAFTLALVGAADRLGAELRTGFEVVAVAAAGTGVAVESARGERIEARVLVNCAGLGAGRVAGLAGDDSFEVYPRKGEFLVFEPPADERLERILLPVPSRGTKGVLVFPTVDGKVVAGPTAVDLERPDWTVRGEAREEIIPRAAAMFPALTGAEPIFAYAGLRPAGRGVNYVIERSRASPSLINVAAIRSTGLTAALAIAERAANLAGEAGISLAEAAPLPRATAPRAASNGPWWRRTADRFAS
jgi:glycerol-3-phosphate dehydrogenase